MSINSFLDQKSSELGFAKWGSASLSQPLTLEFYKTWLEKNYFGEMEYLKTHLPLKENPKLLDTRIESALVFAHPYVPHPKPLTPLPHLRTALYAQGEDYHFWLKDKLKQIAAQLQEQYPDEVFLSFTDSSPVLERDLAYRAGLGWVGKNTCLIDRKDGSLFLIGEIATSLKFQEKAELSHDFCGTCTRCIDICPTKALEAPRLLNAQKCISYLTIESRQTPAPSLRPLIGDHFFGCDLCQTVCPWNQKVFGSRLEVEAKRKLDTSADLTSELRMILTLSGKKLQKLYFGTALMRAGPFGLRRNAMIVAANQRLKELTPEIESFLGDEQLGELAQWTLNQMAEPI